MQRHAIIRRTWDDGGRLVRERVMYPGLANEAPSLDALRRKLPGMIRDLLDGDAIDLNFDPIIGPRHRNPSKTFLL